MNQRERISAVSCGAKLDRIPFAPTIFEHSARFIDKTPSETAIDGHLLEEAHIKAFDIYGHDLVTVGIDVYNIEAEALGCKIKYHEDFSIPGVISHPFQNTEDISGIEFHIKKGRIKLILDAADRINQRIGKQVNVSVGVSGPFSIAAELMGYEGLIFDCITDGVKTSLLLDRILGFQKKYCDEIINRHLGITIFESWAAPPLITPDMYREFVMPFEKELISYIKSRGVAYVPLVIGGDTSIILDDIIRTGTSMLIADYMVNMDIYIEKASNNNLVIRGNIDPKEVELGTKDDVINLVRNMLKKAGGYPKFILGTGVIPYSAPVENIIAITNYLNSIA